MNQKLTYKRYNDANNVIIIDLHNGYSVVAISGYSSDEKNYTVDLYLKENSVNTLTMIEKAENIKISANPKSISSAILKTVAEMFNAGELQYYIDRYNYEIKCFEKGNEFFESERLNAS